VRESILLIIFVCKKNSYMEIKTHIINKVKIAEVIAEHCVINNVDDGLDLLGNVYYQGFDQVIVHEKNITADFFVLKNKIAGDILQKFSNYRMRLIIIGDFSKYNSNSLRDFILESNKGKQVNFLPSLSDVITVL